VDPVTAGQMVPKKGLKKKEYDGIMFEELSEEVKTSSKA
jgi:hypothetical protein